VDKDFQPDATYSGPPISPPQNQPVQKCYKDWNTSFPENSWQISEVGIYVNAAYVKLLSKFADSTTVATSIENLAAGSNDILIYPNPASNVLNVIAKNEVHLEIYNSLGAQIISKQLSEKKSIVNVSDLQSGIYFCRFVNGEFIKTEKIVINR
jgi:hypothetical protein